MKLLFRSLLVNDPSLFSEYIFIKITVHHPVRSVSQVIDELNIDWLLAQYKGGDTSSFHPRVMLKVLFYDHSNNVYPCRKIEKA